MLLPPSFESSSAYFNTAIKFLEDYSWIYQTSNTRFIAENVIDKFPPDWIEYFTAASVKDLNVFPHGNEMEKLPDSLKTFKRRLQLLRSCHKMFKYNGKDVYFKGVSPKKLHEISRLSNFIGNFCGRNHVDIFIDFGAGLGYLSEILHRKYEYNILGLECEEERVRGAIERQTQYFPSSKENIHFKTMKIMDSSSDLIESAANEIFNKIKQPRLAIIGLHACADLSITSMKLFFHIKNVNKLIIMPCCYHKLKLATAADSDRYFQNFPLSETFLEAINHNNGSMNIFNIPFLRLACQETVSRWNDMNEENHLKHGNDMFSRAVIESVAEENENVSKVRNNRSKINENAEIFDILKCKYQIQKKLDKSLVAWNQNHKRRFLEIFSKYHNGGKIAEGLTCLQITLQEICENLVLFDRIVYMQECSQKQGIKVNLQVIKLMDDKLSPRCFALVAEKI